VLVIKPVLERDDVDLDIADLSSKTTQESAGLRGEITMVEFTPRTRSLPSDPHTFHRNPLSIPHTTLLA